MNLNIHLSPRAVTAIIVVFLAVLGVLGYRWWGQTEAYIDEDTWVKAGRLALEKPERERLQAQGLSEDEIDARIEDMWESGELKLPPGEPGLDWSVTPGGGIRILPSPEDLRRGASPSGPGGAGGS